MGRFLAGFAVSLVACGGGYWLHHTQHHQSEDPCGGHCGESTQCVGTVCEAIEDDVAEAEPDAKAPRKKRRRRRRRKGGASSEVTADDAGNDALAPFVPVNDRHIPQFSNKPIVLDMNAGSERLSDDVVDKHMNRLTPKFQSCITTASTYSETDIGSGTLTFKIQLKPTGKVAGISVQAPANLRVFGIVPCVRKVVYDHRFPSYDGPPMGVDFSFDVG